MSTPPPVFFVGNSHTAAIAEAASTHDDVGTSWFKLKSDARHGDVPFTETLEEVSKMSADGLVVVTYFGTMHNIIGLLNNAQPFTTIPDEIVSNTDTKPKTTLIPEQSLRAMFRAAFTKTTVLQDLVNAAPCPVAHLMPPPPKARVDRFLSEGTKLRSQVVGEAGISPVHRRRALWVLENDVVAEFARSVGCEVLDPPAAAFDTDGLLAEAYSANDATHANAAYGTLLIEQAKALREART